MESINPRPEVIHKVFFQIRKTSPGALYFMKHVKWDLMHFRFRQVLKLVFVVMILLVLILQSGCAAHRRLGQVPCPCESQ